MDRKKERRRLRIKLTFIYASMTLLTLALAAVCLLLVQGYRYNFYKGTVEQGGMVQFDSRPNGASIQIDAATLANKTATRITATSGEHTITISKDGFVPWQKQVNVKAGSVLWLNYVKLMPKMVTVHDTVTLEGLDSVVAIPNHSRFVAVENKQNPSLSIIKIDNGSAERKVVSLSEGSYTTEGVTSQSYEVKSWNNDNNKVLIIHTYDNSKEYLVSSLDGTTINVTRDLGVDISSFRFDPSDSSKVYVLTADNTIRRIDLSNKTLSGPLVSNVSNFSISQKGWVYYATNPHDDGERVVGYFSKGASKPRALKTLSNMKDRSLSLAVEEYYNDDYALISEGDKVLVEKVNLPGSDSTDNIEEKLLTTLHLANDVEYTGFSPDKYNYVYAQSGQNLVTYDLELQSIANVSMKQTLTKEISWLDRAHLMQVENGTLEFGDFDGTNMHTLASDATGPAAMMTSNNQYVFYFRKHGSGAITISYIKMYN